MKVNLLLNAPADVRSGYLNIDPLAPPQDPTRVQGRLDDLTHSVDAAECEELVAHDVLDRFGPDQVDGVLEHWLSRLRRGGRITVSAVDAREVARALLNGTLALADANALLHGEQRNDWELRRVSLTLAQLAEALSSRGFKVLTKRVVNYRAVVTAERP
jgi:hypothetical protein